MTPPTPSAPAGVTSAVASAFRIVDVLTAVSVLIAVVAIAAWLRDRRQGAHGLSSTRRGRTTAVVLGVVGLIAATSVAVPLLTGHGRRTVAYSTCIRESTDPHRTLIVCHGTRYSGTTRSPG